MNIYIEKLMTANSFMEFEIGSKLDLSSFVVERDYNPISTSGYYFFNKELDVEVFEQNSLIHSFDILLKNQQNALYLGVKEGSCLNLNNCTIDALITYLNKTNLKWMFDKIISEKSISVVCYSILKISFYFDCENEAPLTLVNISKNE